MGTPLQIARTISLVVTISSFVSCSRAPEKAPVTTSRFQPGQVWTFHTPPDELPTAALTVARVDFDPKLGPIIFVSVTGVRHTVWQATNMCYPFSEDALSRSVIVIVKTNAPLAGEDLKTSQEAYELFRQGVEAGEFNKCFKITLAEVMEANRKEWSAPKNKKRWWKLW
jgi:hypothetical protein